MRRCLRESALVLLFEGEGSSTERAHLEACPTCSERYSRLARDLQALGRVLREEPPPQPLRRRSNSLQRRWIPAVAALVLIVVSLWGLMRMERQVSLLPSEESSFQDTALYPDDASTAIFAPADDSSGEISYADSDFRYLNTALGEDANF